MALPTSFTTTDAPRRAKSSAYKRPRPRPAPLTTTACFRNSIIGSVRSHWAVRFGRRRVLEQCREFDGPAQERRVGTVDRELFDAEPFGDEIGQPRRHRAILGAADGTARDVGRPEAGEGHRLGRRLAATFGTQPFERP